MPHESRGMPEVENPGKRFGEAVRRIDLTRAEAELQVAKLLPLLESKVANIYVTGPGCRTVMLDHFDGRFVVLINRGRAILRVAQFL